MGIKISNPFKKAQPSRRDQVIAVGKNAATLVVFSWLIQKGVEGLDAAVKGAAQGFKTAKENMAAKREAANTAAEAQANAATSESQATSEEASASAAA